MRLYDFLCSRDSLTGRESRYDACVCLECDIDVSKCLARPPLLPQPGKEEQCVCKPRAEYAACHSRFASAPLRAVHIRTNRYRSIVDAPSILGKVLEGILE